MRKLFYISFLSFLSLFFISCNSINNNKILQSNDISSIEKEHSNNFSSDIINKKHTKDNIKRSFKIVTKNKDFKVINNDEITTVGLTVAENLNKILGIISNKYFDNEVIELKEITNNKTAIINLSGNADYWYNRIKHSSKGQITEYTLIENVLQRHYSGFWIDAVQFTINGDLIENIGYAPNLSKITYK
ncbi:MAG: hypothetical protein ACRDD2_08715 [Sarcina sp.]